MKCWECKTGKYSYKNVDFSVHGISLGKFKAKVCNKCKDTVFDEKVSDKIDALAKKKGLWGLESHTKVGKVGNSLDIKIAHKVAKFLELKKGEEVTIYPESKNRLIVDIG
ncbi:MAG: hypothetical protein KAT77_04030 [Nanoarchaeota archaeon]|nr:hypothetical protein [Nanoarchaeota archaeon]